MSFSHIDILTHVFMLGNFIGIRKFKMVCFYSWVEYKSIGLPLRCVVIQYFSATYVNILLTQRWNIRIS